MTDTTKRAAIYARVSSEHQRKNNSLELQLKKCRGYASQQGFTVAPEHEFVDVFTGTKLDRPAFDEAKSVVGKVDAIVFHVHDRLGRADVLDTVQQIRWFEQHGTRVHITSRGEIDTTDDMGLIMLILEVQAAKKERDHIIRRTTDGRYGRAEKGKFCGARMAKYGYNYDKQTGLLVLNEQEWPWALRIFEWHGIERLGQIAIANRLQALEVPTKYDNLGLTKPRSPRCRWRTSTVAQILKDPIYRGEWVYGRHNKDTRPPQSISVPAIVSPELWAAGQQVSIDNKVNNNKGGQKYPALFYGRITCARCGRMFKQAHRTRDQGHSYYQCGGQILANCADGKHKTCTGSFDLPTLDNKVWDALMRELRHPEHIFEEMDKSAGEREAKMQPDREYMQRLESEVTALDARWERVRKSYNDGATTIDDLKKDKAQIDYDRKMRQDKIAELRESLSVVVHDREVREAFRTTVLHLVRGGEVATYEEKRAIIEALNIRLTVHRGESRRNGRKAQGTGHVKLTASVALKIDVELDSDGANLSVSSCDCGKVQTVQFSLSIELDQAA